MDSIGWGLNPHPIAPSAFCLLPSAFLQEDYYLVIGENIQQETSPVFAKLTEDADISKEYSSLTKMMLYLAENLETKDNRKI
ncbi:MAG: hypothetical protein KME31_04655 [Tolypothrix carrinoi HA7290-LM1]|nr:hypothetical protein [Tolypothrix carrinoi HA7290-LM1]